MKTKLTMELTPTQYQQLVECYFTGSIRLDTEDMWSSLKSGNNRLLQQLLEFAQDYGKENMVVRRGVL